jgi:hypothetical protein
MSVIPYWAANPKQVSPDWTVTLIGGSGEGVSVGASVSVGRDVNVIVEVIAGAVGAFVEPGVRLPPSKKTMINAPRMIEITGPAITTPTGSDRFDDVPLIRAGARMALPVPDSKTIPHTAQRAAVSAIRVPQAGHIRLGMAGRGLVFVIFSPFGVGRLYQTGFLRRYGGIQQLPYFQG